MPSSPLRQRQKPLSDERNSSTRIITKLYPITSNLDEGYAVALSDCLLLDADWNIWSKDKGGQWQCEPSANGRRALAKWLDERLGPVNVTEDQLPEAMARALRELK